MEEIRVITRGRDLLKIGPKAFLDFIAPFVKEKAFIVRQKVPTMAQQRVWVKKQAAELDHGRLLFVLLFDNGRLAGNCACRQSESEAEIHNAHFGLIISKPFRGIGWGEKLLRMAIAEAKKRFEPHRMWIECVDGNKAAHCLYKKVGFVEVGRLGEYHNHYGRWCDKVLMQYKPGRNSKSRRR